MKPPCMIIVQYVLPGIRVLVMKDLVEKYNMRKIDAAARMKLTPAAITQYLKGNRGAMLIEEIEKCGETMKIVSELSRALVKNSVPEELMIEKLCEACMILRNKGIGACASLKAK